MLPEMDEAVLYKARVDGKGLHLTLGNHRAALEPARLAVLGFLEPAALPPRVIFQIELILEEMLMNAIWHAFEDEGVHAIELTVQLLPDEVVLSFEDDGIAFDPTQAAEPARPARPASLIDAPTGGRGLMLVRRAARSVAYERREGRNRLRIAVSRS